jgi:hypothetical protein
MQANLVREVNEEAERLFDVIGEFIDEPRRTRTTLTSVELSRGMKTSYYFKQNTGTMSPYPHITLAHQSMKSRKYKQNTHRMFQTTGALRRYFGTHGKSVVKSRLGGIQVTVSQPNVKFDYGVSMETFLAGRINIKIFPKLSPALAPGILSNNWSQVAQSGALERNLFPAGVARKLVNKGNPYRPLVAPTLQFFALVRIPNQIQRTLLKNHHARKRSIK